MGKMLTFSICMHKTIKNVGSIAVFWQSLEKYVVEKVIAWKVFWFRLNVMFLFVIYKYLLMDLLLELLFPEMWSLTVELTIQHSSVGK